MKLTQIVLVILFSYLLSFCTCPYEDEIDNLLGKKKKRISNSTNNRPSKKRKIEKVEEKDPEEDSGLDIDNVNIRPEDINLNSHKNKNFKNNVLKDAQKIENDDPAISAVENSNHSNTNNVKPKNNKKSEELIRNILKKDYIDFFEDLEKNFKDPKFIAAIETLAAKGKVQINKIKNLSVLGPKPTQNEVDLMKSVEFILRVPGHVYNVLKCNKDDEKGIKINNTPIVTANEGRLIVDGHHRWSQVFLANPNCVMEADDLPELKDPVKALMATQLAIAVSPDKCGHDRKKIPKSKVDGKNLFEIKEEEFVDYVLETLEDDVLTVYKELRNLQTSDAVAAYLWQNVELMREKSQPVEGAPQRDVMPQTDEAKEWDAKVPKLD